MIFAWNEFGSCVICRIFIFLLSVQRCDLMLFQPTFLFWFNWVDLLGVARLDNNDSIICRNKDPVQAIYNASAAPLKTSFRCVSNPWFQRPSWIFHIASISSGEYSHYINGYSVSVRDSIHIGQVCQMSKVMIYPVGSQFSKTYLTSHPPTFFPSIKNHQTILVNSTQHTQ